MASADKNRYVQALFDSGADAFDNMYDVYITPPGYGSSTDTPKLMTVRADGFTVPPASTSTYKKAYHGNEIDAPAPKQTFERKFTLTFRMDAAYNIHDFFLQWQSAVVNPNTGGVANIAPFIGKVEVRALNTGFIASGETNSILSYTNDHTQTNSGGIKDENTRVWVFDQCWVSNVGQPAYKTSGGAAMTFTVDFFFGECHYPGYAN
jgi:hypothetical protein